MVRRILRLVAIVALLCSGLATSSYSSAGAVAQTWTLAPADEAEYVSNINDIRIANGLGPLMLDTNMREAARNWTYWMAENTTLAHADDIVTGAPADWLKVGENVGRGGALADIWQAFLDSPSHAANVLDPAFDLVGIGVVWTNEGRQYTTHRFASTESAGNSVPIIPVPTPESSPDPVTTSEPEQAVSPPQLPFAVPSAPVPPADPARVAMTMSVLLAAGH
ncbi:MAG: CAP domain-containing protein [Acidimicrobiales bacterium]